MHKLYVSARLSSAQKESDRWSENNLAERRNKTRPRHIELSSQTLTSFPSCFNKLPQRVVAVVVVVVVLIVFISAGVVIGADWL